jgi:hypothetical protein
MTFSTSDFIIGLKRQYPIVATDSEASQHSLLKPNGQKNKDARDRIQSDPAISRYRAPNIDRRQSLLEHITEAVSMKTRLKQVTILTQEESQIATFISTIRGPLRRQSSSCRSGGKGYGSPALGCRSSSAWQTNARIKFHMPGRADLAQILAQQAQIQDIRPDRALFEPPSTAAMMASVSLSLTQRTITSRSCAILMF